MSLLPAADLRAIQAGVLLRNGRGERNQKAIHHLRARLGLPALESKEKYAFVYSQGTVEMGLLLAEEIRALADQIQAIRVAA